LAVDAAPRFTFTRAKRNTRKDNLIFVQAKVAMPTKLILLIDDEANVREVVQACLKDLGGWNVLSVASAQEGLKMLSVERPDVILLDVLMPGMDGITFIQQIKDNPLAQAIPVLLLTSKARWFTPRQLQQLGVVDAIPFGAALTAAPSLR